MKNQQKKLFVNLLIQGRGYGFSFCDSKFRNNQQCCQGSKMLYEIVFQCSSSVPSWSKQHPGLHVEVDRECQD